MGKEKMLLPIIWLALIAITCLTLSTIIFKNVVAIWGYHIEILPYQTDPCKQADHLSLLHFLQGFAYITSSRPLLIPLLPINTRILNTRIWHFLLNLHYMFLYFQLWVQRCTLITSMFVTVLWVHISSPSLAKTKTPQGTALCFNHW